MKFAVSYAKAACCKARRGYLRFAMAFAGVLVGAGFMAPGAAHASLVGALVQVQYLYPTTADVYLDDGAATVTPGTSFTLGSLLTISFGDNSIDVQNLSTGAYLATPFNGVDLTFLSGPAITGVTEDPTSSPLFATGSVVTFSNSDIRLNLAGTCAACEGGETIRLDLSTSVPEPASLTLLGAGLLAFALKRRQASAA